TSAPLFTGPFPGTVRMAPLGMFGRVSTESGWLHLLHDDSKRGRVLIRPQAVRHRVSPSMPGKPGWRISRGGKDGGRSQPL
ncbi:MAG: hypothetical protein VCF24_27835, partial [Candidatus Latescibacterota bacterium]